MDSKPATGPLRSGGQGPYPLNGKVAVITGASSGIGEACARRLAAGGAKIVIGYNTGKERAEAVLNSLEGSGHSCVRIPATDSAQIVAAAAEVERRYGKVDILVNSAGIAKVIPHEDLDALTDEIFDEIMTTNARGPFATIRSFLPLLRNSGDAVIVNISSIAAMTGKGSSIAYCAAKAAVDTIGLSLGRALGPDIRVIGISPAAVATPILPELGRARAEKQAITTPLRTVTEADDVAMAVLAAVTHLRLTTGSTVVVDGGRHLA